jgi:hypothetical protein
MFPFTLREFLDMIASYNNAFWPMPLVAYALGIIAVILTWLKSDYASKAATGILVLFWLWTGIVFNGLWFSELWSRVMLFTVLFVIQAILLAWTGILKPDLSFRARADRYGLVGGLVILYGMAGYPAIESLLGRGYPQALLLGMVPCPTIVFTLGMLLWSDRPTPRLVLVIPVFYAVVGGALVASQGIVEDLGMVVFGLLAVSMILYRNRTIDRGMLYRPPANA